VIEPIWDDDRLRRAYGDGFGRPAPAGLAGDVAETVRKVHARASGRRLPAWVALAAVVVVTVGVGAVMSSRPRADDDSPPTARGLPVLTVSEALVARGASPEAREIAVRGFLSPVPLGIRCRFSGSHAFNPVRLECPADFGWLLETPSPLDGIRSTLPPDRVGLQPLFPGLDMAPLRAGDGPELPEVVLIGHFHDRRGSPALCDVPNPSACDGFVASAIYSVNGKAIGTSTVIDLAPLAPRAQPRLTWTVEGVDEVIRRHAPDLEVLSRVALPGQRIAELEPALGTGAFGIIDRPVAWIVNGLQMDGHGDPSLRTIVVVDGSPATVYQADRASRVGFAPVGLAEPAVSASPGPPSSDAAFPAEVHGLTVVSVTEVEAWVKEAISGTGGLPPDTAIAVRGYFVIPPSSIACPLPRSNVEPLNPIDRYCPEGIAWLMKTSEPPWELIDGVRRWRRPLAPSMNLIIPAAAPFGLPAPVDNPSAPTPVPVVAVGHYGDDRSGRWDGAPRFIVDAVAWREGASTGGETIVLGDPPTETRAAVEARVELALGASRVTWAAVVDGSMLKGVDGSPDGELAKAHSVWQLGRLVGDLRRPAVEYAYTIDGTDRIWEPGGLAPERRVEIEVGGGRHAVIEIIDWPDLIVGARDARQEAQPTSPRIISKDVAVPFALSNPVGTPNELRIRWTASDCDARWRVWLSPDARYLELQPTRREDCAAVAVQVDIVLKLSRALPADAFLTNAGGGGG
jgi:hypothetical protein